MSCDVIIEYDINIITFYIYAFSCLFRNKYLKEFETWHLSFTSHNYMLNIIQPLILVCMKHRNKFHTDQRKSTTTVCKTYRCTIFKVVNYPVIPESTRIINSILPCRNSCYFPFFFLSFFLCFVCWASCEACQASSPLLIYTASPQCLLFFLSAICLLGNHSIQRAFNSMKYYCQCFIRTFISKMKVLSALLTKHFLEFPPHFVWENTMRKLE